MIVYLLWIWTWVLLTVPTITQMLYLQKKLKIWLEVHCLCKDLIVLVDGRWVILGLNVFARNSGRKVCLKLRNTIS